MPKIPDPNPAGDKERAIADAEALFQDDASAQPKPASMREGPSASAPGGYDLEAGGASAEVPVPIPDFAADSSQADREAERHARRVQSAGPTVRQVWSRGAEWGPNLALLAIVMLVVAFLLYLTMSVADLSLTFVILLIGGLVLLVLSYPIFITLERPVRVTPEQAVKDFYGALSHHFPHYRRMWLLLSSSGRTSVSYASFEGFKSYWKRRQAELRKGRAGGTTPLVFSVDDFKSEKSAGKTTIDVKCTVNVFPRGKRDQPPLESIRLNMGLAKGPDQMWYLNKGTLP
jgi:hypothetical protein